MASPSDIDDSLLKALAQYVTTGTDTGSTTKQDIQELATETMSRPGGRAHLEALVASDRPDHQLWKIQAVADGTIAITKTHVSIRLAVDTLELTFEASGEGFFVPWSGSLNVGTLLYNDLEQLLPGDATLKLHVSVPDFHVSIFRNEVCIGKFYFSNIGFILPPSEVSLDGMIF
ncbi:hypothetical protein FVEN_g2112 [Fusarium venenatum]|uniref:Uncharacterized protein n=1 Tax=Fusarium venenatum TaxID=56646 RepID=A0A2L2TE52_9HYPO|nr:uncharacterized protein FVRRES_12523 [Fusarium venenatum]KAG8360371.1 hypothetical protein FVEN_g2112 [Fusarium venenatum]KAH6979136.1 hypothetical protein EDB82DRAFT_246944 [Fusarium venenatum]CEI39832.1 unnamed protein product [Fusarium venenatum]